MAATLEIGFFCFQKRDKKTGVGGSLQAQCVKDLALSLWWLWSLLRYQFNPWLGIFLFLPHAFFSAPHPSASQPSSSPSPQCWTPPNPASRRHISTAVKRGIYDKFGEEGLKGGIPLEFGSQTPWTTGYVFHGNPEKVFHEFFGGDNPFNGKRSCLSLCRTWKGHSCRRCFSLSSFIYFKKYISEFPCGSAGYVSDIVITVAQVDAVAQV